MLKLTWGTAWNLWLAVIPVLLAWVLVAAHREMKKRPTPIMRFWLTLVAFLWLAWLPNTCYLMTEWRHLLEIVDGQNLAIRAAREPQLYLRIGMLSVFYLFYSSFGTFALVLAIRPIERIFRQYGVKAWLWAAPLFFMLSVGVYLGLVLRFNSWDLWHRPRVVFMAGLDIAERPALLATIFFYTLLLWMLYEAIDLWMDGVMERLRPQRK